MARLLQAMRDARDWTYANTLTVKLLLMLAVRKSELIGARIEAFDLDGATWHLPVERTKTGAAIDIPLSRQAVALLNELVRLAGGSAWLLPARKMQTRMIPHIDPNTLNAAMAKSIQPRMGLASLLPSTISGLLRARTWKRLELFRMLPSAA